MKSLCPKCMSEIDAKALNMTLVELLPCGSSGAVRRAMCHALSIRQIGFDKSSGRLQWTLDAPRDRWAAAALISLLKQYEKLGPLQTTRPWNICR